MWIRVPQSADRSIPACAGEPYHPRRPAALRWVYPRVCGGTQMLCGEPVARTGLSPRVRGNQDVPGQDGVIDGSIPACAGEPTVPIFYQLAEGVYPRVCGGTFPTAGTAGRRAGLSPRVRGNRLNSIGLGLGDGSIPACAGEPFASVTLTNDDRVYPRVCGGTRGSRPPSSVQSGLSPRVRGNRPSIADHSRQQRSIPACAGEPASRTGCTGACGVYPRVCGEPRRCRTGPTGSSVYPRVCGGTRPASWWRPGGEGLSPRVRGTAPLWKVTMVGVGLSPRVRGNRSADGGLATWNGSIPACAGEPMRAAVAPADGGVYPRVCGGTSRPGTRAFARTGLSPRVRGNPSTPVGSILTNGSIPACAGEP